MRSLRQKNSFRAKCAQVDALYAAHFQGQPPESDPMGARSPSAEGAVRQVHQDAGKSLTGKQEHAEKLPKHVSRRLFLFN
tara:strand:+ start:268 stop:507 length:240 start_codon:yes stop_codon:yes gene_type:complete